MNTLPDINILPTSGRLGTNEGFQSGNSSGDDIFQSILNSLDGSSSNNNWVSTIYSDNNTNSSFHSGSTSSSDNTADGTGSVRENASVNRSQKDRQNPDDLIIPSSLQNHLVTFLEKQGFSLKDINQVISASRNRNGLIRLDKLLAGLSANNSAGNKQGMMLVATFKEGFSTFLKEQGIDPNNFGHFFAGLKNKNSVLSGSIDDLLSGNQKDKSFIDSTQISDVEEILFKMGLGAGDVKKIIEKSKNGNGELELGKLSMELNKFLSAPLSESDITSLFSKNNISVNEHLLDAVNSRKDKSDLLTGNDKYLSEAAQKELKQNIEALLKEKGVSEENIRSVLEKLDTAFTKKNLERGAATGESALGKQQILNTLTGEKQIISSMLGDPVKQDIAAFLKKKGASDRDVKSFLDSFRLQIKNANMSQTNDYLKSSLLNEKAFEQAKNDQFLSPSDQGNLKLNLTEIFKLAEKKANEVQLAKSSGGNIPSGAIVKNASTGKDSTGFLGKETAQVSGLNISQSKEIKNIGKVNQANASATLPEPIPRIVDKMLIMIRTGEYKSRLKITPPELGKLDIDLTVKNGHIHANLNAENAVVKEIIEANLNQLKHQLSNQGLTVDRFDVMVGFNNGEQKNSNTWTEGRNEKGSGYSSGSKSGSHGEILASPPVERNLINDNQIDVHV